MAAVTRLLTLVDVDDEGPDARRLSVAARQEAVLEDGRRVVVLDDRGWSEQLNVVRPDDAPAAQGEPPSIWAFVTVEELDRDAGVVVGPDEPVAGCTHADMEASYW